MNFFRNFSSSSNKEYNILLLGETGAGKSTTINAFANYMRHSTFEEAIDGDFVELIASKFVLSDPSGEPVVIKSGKDDNEQGMTGSGGKSSTKEPRTYKFQYGNSVIRLIDTPGIGDTSGIDQDKENFDQILSMLHCFKELHGILILLKSNETRKTAFFQYCIAELLTHLHKSACENIVVCFTFSRNSFYAPGDGFSTLKSFLKDDLQEVKLDLRPNKNCYFIDNEAYRFLVAKKSGFRFPNSQTATFQESWDKSVEQSSKMFAYITAMQPHDLENTTSLNSARKLIYEIAEPMVRLQNNIDSNISHIKDKENELQNSNRSKMDLAQDLEIEVDDLKQIDLNYPTTVCTADECTETINYKNEQKINYIRRCHEDCQLTGVQVNKVGHSDLQNCWAMDDSRMYCRMCGCSWQVHMHLTCTFEKVKRSIIDTNKQTEVNCVDDAIANINAALGDMRTTVQELEQEMKVIEDLGSKFAYILIEHSNTPYNKFIEPYLDLLINEEKKKMGAVKNYPRKKLDSLEMMKATHVKNVAILTKAINNKSAKPIKIGDIFKYRNELCQLKHCGPQFAQMLKNTAFMTNKNFKLVEKTGVTVTSAAFGGWGGGGSGGGGSGCGGAGSSGAGSSGDSGTKGARGRCANQGPNQTFQPNTGAARGNNRTGDNGAGGGDFNANQSHNPPQANRSHSNIYPNPNYNYSYPQFYQPPPNFPENPNFPPNYSPNYPPTPMNYPYNYGNQQAPNYPYPHYPFPNYAYPPYNGPNMHPSGPSGSGASERGGQGSFPPNFGHAQHQQPSSRCNDQDNNNASDNNQSLLSEIKNLISKMTTSGLNGPK